MSKNIVDYTKSIKKASDVFGNALMLKDADANNIYVQLDNSQKPENIIFSVKAFWELMCQIDEALVDKLSDEDYQHNLAGRIVDAIESNWDVGSKDSTKIKQDFDTALQEISSARTA